MSDFGLFTSKFRQSTNLLRDFDRALRYLKRSESHGDSQDAIPVGAILTVLKPISKMLEGNLSESTSFDEESVIEILYRRHGKFWQAYKERVIKLTNELESGKTKVSEDEFSTLNDIADAISIECATLFKRIGRHP
jgi:hypothetical protein